MVGEEILIAQAKTLSVSKFNELTLERKKLTYKFHQLLVGMICVIPTGHDDFDFEIVAINYDEKTFDYIDLSYAEDKRSVQTSSPLFIPSLIYHNQKKFVFCELDDNIMFQKFNLTPFEKNLHSRLHIKFLKKIINEQKHLISKMQNAFDSQVYFETETKKVSNLRNTLNALLKKNKMTESDVFETEEYKTRIGSLNKPRTDKEIIDKYKFELNTWIDKCNKYRKLYFELLGNQK